MRTCYPSAVKNSSSIRYTVSNKKTNQSASFFHRICFSATIFGTCCLIVLSTSSYRQINTYGYSTSTGVPLETGFFTNLLGTFTDDVSPLTNIGFTLNFNSVNYTNFSVTSNGLLQFGESVVTDFENLIGNLDRTVSGSLLGC